MGPRNLGPKHPLTDLLTDSRLASRLKKYFLKLGGVFLLIVHPHIPVQGTNEQFLQAGATFSLGLASESHWLQPVMILTVQWWPAPICVGGL